ncbi:Aminotran-1-2 domain-containing protein [Mycena sanguinolenta]|uniref:Aminotran-1-2 domain-containing protein n=1 Tax=Mycena sanguinolenta TaxID=230812 RepID=A0A8H7D6S7_9AGAR|nr:Aminotran-1-2 domain-containing protein [Mycena sanguinolenta]
MLSSSSMSTVVDIVPFLSKNSKLWKACGIRGLLPLENIPGMISLLAGRPNASTFPFESITMKLKPTLAGLPEGEDAFTIRLEDDELTESLQYGMTAGVSRLVNWLENFQTEVHKRELDDSWNVIVGAGSQELMYKACEALINDGDYILLETPVYAGTLGFLAALPCTLVEANADSSGLDPANLEIILANWETTHPGKPYPKLLYTVPSGSNPTGASIPEYRKVEVLKLAKKYNFLILEDEAYGFLYYGPEGKKARSYFALEPEVNGEAGRVVRFDSFSKVLSSGMRLGFMTASPRLSGVVNMITSNTNLQPSSLAQIMAYALLSRWGPQGFLAHCAGVAAFYRTRRDTFERVARKHLSGLADWTSPVAGMFLYIKLLVHPDGRTSDSLKIILEKAVNKGVLAVPGTAFMPLAGPTPFVRVSFSLIEEDMAEEACRRLREAILDARAEAEGACE